MSELSDDLRCLADTLDLYQIDEIVSIQQEPTTSDMSVCQVHLPFPVFRKSVRFPSISPRTCPDFPWELSRVLDGVKFFSVATDDDITKYGGRG